MDRVGQIDQARMDARGTARILCAFYEELREAEMDEATRSELTVMYSKMLFDKGKK